jgi:dihydrofolate reductase
MKNLSLIVAIGKNNELGKDNDLIWHFKDDMKFFKNTTMNHTVIMGRKTFESLPKILPNRTNVVITSNMDYQVDGAEVIHSFDEALKYIEDSKDECFIIGGASIYKKFLEYADTLYITKIDAMAEADVYFPSFDEEMYKCNELESHEEDGIKYTIYKYEKKDTV